jgi:hypothetical protein
VEGVFERDAIVDAANAERLSKSNFDGLIHRSDEGQSWQDCRPGGIPSHAVCSARDPRYVKEGRN